MLIDVKILGVGGQLFWPTTFHDSNRLSMSTDTMPSDPAKKSKKKHKHDTEHKSKKRHHEEEDRPNSPTKKQRTKEEKKPKTLSHAQSTVIPGPEVLEKHTAFVQQTTSLYLALSPVCQSYALQGLCAEHLSPLLLTYYPPLHGIVLSYTNPRLSERPEAAPVNIPESIGQEAAPVVLARTIDEYAASFVWLTADFTLFKPVRGSWIEGHITVQNESYLGLVCWNFFNAGIERKRLPANWSWVEAGEKEQDESKKKATMVDGYFVDGAGQKKEGLLRFRVRDLDAAPSTDTDRGYVSIEGTLLNDKDDRAVDKDGERR